VGPLLDHPFRCAGLDRGGNVNTTVRAGRVDRDELFLELTRSICPVCKAVIDAELNVRAGRVLLRKRCREHGVFEALVYSDAELYLRQLGYNKPGTLPLEFQTEVSEGCPLDCGLCPEHKQHACLAVLELNSGCNLDCPLCFADSGHQPDGFSLTRAQVGFMLDRFVAAEGEPEVVQFSGGEPTIHPQLVEFVGMPKERGIRFVMVNTNGIRLARDRRFAERLAVAGPHVYLQFDGFDATTHLALRGKDLRAEKEQALERCAELGLSVTLVAAVERGVNEHELGAIVRLGIGHAAVNSVVFQPVTHSGRHPLFDPLERLTNADVMHLLTQQLPDSLRVSDFVPVPCCFPSCRSMCYALIDGDRLLPLARLIDVDRYLDYAANRVVPLRGAARARGDVLGLCRSWFGGGAARVRELRHRAAGRVCRSAQTRVCDHGAGLPGRLHAQRAPADEVLRQPTDPGRAADPVLRLQLGRLPRAGPRAAHRRAGRAGGA
jgi:uncharacterized radical SAM superfamily Fe-S cluster-containing enzyme